MKTEIHISDQLDSKPLLSGSEGNYGNIRLPRHPAWLSYLSGQEAWYLSAAAITGQVL
jgi:hypothetical protein